MSNKDWTSKLRDQMTDYQEPVKHDLWAGIAQSLAQNQPVEGVKGIAVGNPVNKIEKDSKRIEKDSSPCYNFETMVGSQPSRRGLAWNRRKLCLSASGGCGAGQCADWHPSRHLPHLRMLQHLLNQILQQKRVVS